MNTPTAKKPNHKEHPTDDGMHLAMEYWANAQVKPELLLYLDDEAEPFHRFQRMQKDVTYRTSDGETYEVQVDTGKFDPDFLMTYGESLKHPKGVSSKTIHTLWEEWLKKSPTSNFYNARWRFELDVEVTQP